MIGTIVSMRYIGQRNWWESIVFWAVYLFVSTILVSLVAMADIQYLGFIVATAVFFVLAIKWYMIPWRQIITLWLVAIAIDFIIGLALADVLIPVIGNDWAQGLMPVLSLTGA